jgi:2-polyprenyl-3-methyl-5-hydroxy-6-metoxy-1,4-benzoquinol methylase
MRKHAMNLIPRCLFMRGDVPRYEAAYDTIERFYQAKPDLWEFERKNYEMARFDRILEVIRRVPHASILDVGCAKGHLTRRLCGIAKEVVAIDVSSTAVERTREVAPEAQVLGMSLEAARFDWHFDLVVCSETIYYLKDILGAIRKLNSLAEFVLVTYTLYERHRLDPLFAGMPVIFMEPLHYLRFFDQGRVVNWRGTQIVLWWSGALKDGVPQAQV